MTTAKSYALLLFSCMVCVMSDTANLPYYSNTFAVPDQIANYQRPYSILHNPETVPKQPQPHKTTPNSLKNRVPLESIKPYGGQNQHQQYLPASNIAPQNQYTPTAPVSNQPYSSPPPQYNPGYYPGRPSYQPQIYNVYPVKQSYGKPQYQVTPYSRPAAYPYPNQYQYPLPHKTVYLRPSVPVYAYKKSSQH